MRINRIGAALLFLLTLVGCVKDHPDNIIAPRDSKTVARGKELVHGLAACGRCHGQTPSPTSPLSGGQTVYDLYGPLPAPNITSSSTGIGSWDDETILNSLRGNWGDEAKHRSPQVHRGYEWISDRDGLSIVSYLRTLSPIKNEVERRSVTFMDRNTTGFFESQFAVQGYVPNPSKQNQVQYGKYLVDVVARCGVCHSTPATLLTNEVYLGGGDATIEGEAVSAPALIGGKETMSYWSEGAIALYLQTGKRPDGSYIDPAKCPVEFFKNGAESDLQAIALYIRSLS